jgi:hypothetical protein
MFIKTCLKILIILISALTKLFKVLFMGKKRLFRGKRGSLAIYIAFVMIALSIILFGAVIAPMGAMMNTQFYLAGENILSLTNSSLNSIQNVTVRQALLEANSAAMGTTQTNIEVSVGLFKYSWIFVLVCSAIVVFLFTRRLVEYGGGQVY